jgi:putative transposase
MKTYERYRYPSQIISHAVWLYHRFTPSLGDLETNNMKKHMKIVL